MYIHNIYFFYCIQHTIATENVKIIRSVCLTSLAAGGNPFTENYISRVFSLRAKHDKSLYNCCVIYINTMSTPQKYNVGDKHAAD